MNDAIVEHLPDSTKFLDERTTARIVFLRKLYGLLALQYIVSFLVLTRIQDNEDAKAWIKAKNGLAIGFTVGQVLIAILVYFARKSFRKTPLNGFIYLVFTGLLAYNLTYYADASKVTQIFVASIFVLSISLMIYALTTRLDLTFLGGTIYILGSALFSYLGALITTDLAFFVLILTTLAIIVIGFYLIYDTRFIIVGQSLSSQMEDPFVGSIVIYLDMFFLAFRLIESLGKLFKRSRF